MTGSNLNFDERIKFHSQWAGLCDQLESLTSEETDRRSVLRDSMAGEPLYTHILDQTDTREAMGRISVFFSYRDAEGPYVPRPRADKTDCAADRTNMVRRVVYNVRSCGTLSAAMGAGAL